MVPYEAVIVHVAGAVVQLPQGYLLSASLAVGVCFTILLEYLDNINPVHPVEVITEVASVEGQPGAPWEGALALSNAPGKANLIDSEEVFVLAYR